MKHLDSFLLGAALAAVILDAVEEKDRTRFHGNPWNGKIQKFAVHCRSHYDTCTIVSCTGTWDDALKRLENAEKHVGKKFVLESGIISEGIEYVFLPGREPFTRAPQWYI